MLPDNTATQDNEAAYAAQLRAKDREIYRLTQEVERGIRANGALANDRQMLVEKSAGLEEEVERLKAQIVAAHNKETELKSAIGDRAPKAKHAPVTYAMCWEHMRAGGVIEMRVDDWARQRRIHNRIEQLRSCVVDCRSDGPGAWTDWRSDSHDSMDRSDDAYTLLPIEL